MSEELLQVGVRFSTDASTYHNRLFIRSPTIIEVKHYPKNERKLGKYTHFPHSCGRNSLFFTCFTCFCWAQETFHPLQISPSDLHARPRLVIRSPPKVERGLPKSTRGLWGGKEALRIKFQGFPKKNKLHTYKCSLTCFNTKVLDGFGGILILGREILIFWDMYTYILNHNFQRKHIWI